MRKFSVFSLFALAGTSLSLCPGYNFAFFSLGKPPGGTSAWLITDDGCNDQDGGICWNNNPCDCPGVGCTSAPVHVGSVFVNGLWYACRPDGNAGTCDTHGILSARPESCCRNDGRRNLAEGLINERQLAAIEETAVLLDKQKREYVEALESGMSGRDIEAMRAVHKRDLESSEMKER